MKLEQKLPKRKWVSFMMFASLVIVSLISAPLVNAQAENPQTPTVTATPTQTLTIEPSAFPATATQAAQSSTLPVDQPEENDPAPATKEPVVVNQDSQDAADWSLEYDLSVPADQLKLLGSTENARSQTEKMLASKALAGRGIAAQVVAGRGYSYRVSLQGRSKLAQLRGLIFSDLQPELDLLNGPVEINISLPVTRGQDVPLLLESRPATGYIWELDPSASTGVALADQPSVMSKVEQPSAPAVEGMLLRGTDDSQASIRLVYHRPWEADQPATRRMRLTLPAVSDTIDLSNPVVVEQQSAPDLELPMVGEPVVGLPSSFDWRSQGKTPPVRDQGSCGSCWSFGTVGAMESAMMVQAGMPAPNLSEQFLISCNTQNYGCNGGWWAHDYHISKLGTNQTSAGAVLESVKPYLGTKGTCSANVSKAYKLGSWGYVNGSYNSIPSVDQLKNTIYTYGSAAVSVCAGSAWSSYRGGVFSTDEKSQCTGTGQVNHAVLLVGWNDADQTWLLRNSWGSSWGDGGYMHIRWGTSNVGYGATYVLYSNSSPAPTATKTSTPTRQPTATKTATATPKPTITRTPTKTATPLPAPATNDNVSSAKTIDYQGGIVQFREKISTAGTTNESGDPYYPTTPAKQFLHTVWYKFTPYTKGTLAVSTSGSNYDTVVGVWTGQPGSWKRIKWNDTYGTSRTAALSFAAVPNTTYYIEVAAKSTGGILSFYLKFTPPVLSNNSITYASGIPYAGVTTQSTYSTVLDISRSNASTSDPLFPNNYGRGYRTTWFKFTPKVNGTLQVSTSGSNFSNLIGIWNKSTTYKLVGWSSGGSGQISITGGKTYYIEIASVAATGPSILHFWMNFQP